MLKTNLSIVLLLSLFQANAMQLPVATPERRPIEESMFELFAHNQERMAALESTDKQLSEQTIDCLLYTSPSPRDLSTSRMPSSA